jgi:hypothetical protein
MAPAHAVDVGFIVDARNGRPAFDPRGRLIYRTSRSQPGTGSSNASADSAAIVRDRGAVRGIDTLTMIRVPIAQIVRAADATTATFRFDPSDDDWAVMDDGVIAIVRGQDYHVDWVQLDGSVTATPKMPFAWHRISEDEKARLVDSARSHMAVAAGPLVLKGMANELPSFFPPIYQGHLRSDPDGNLWILPTSTAIGHAGLTFDVVNRLGSIVRRVQLPEGRDLLAVGRHNVLYLSHAVGPNDVRLERATIVSP